MPNKTEEQQALNRDERAKEKLNEGSAWMSIASVISRILGVLYIIPWMRWIGDPHTGTQANALYSIGYNYYSIFLSIAIAGVPAAISKQMTNYMARGQYGTSQRLFKSGTVMMTVTGLVCALVLYLAAPVLSKNLPAASEEEVVLVIRSLVPALALIPVLSIFRGFFQAYLEMKPSAVSQVTEQIARVFYMLLTVYLIRKVLDGSVATAVAHSTFAAFIGAFVAILTLGYYYWRGRSYYQVPEGYVDTNPVSTRSLLLEIFKIAIPFVITGSIIEMINLVDMNTYIPIMQRVSGLSHDQLVYEYGVFNANARRVIQIILSFATAISSTTVPVVTDTYIRELTHVPVEKLSAQEMKKTFQKTREVILHTLNLFALVMLPASLGLALVAGPIYQLLYGVYDPLGEWYLQISCLMAIPMGLFYVLVMTLQSMDEQKKAMFGIVLGVGMKLLIQFPLLGVFGSEGAMYASLLAFVYMCAYYFMVIHGRVNLSAQAVIKRLLGAFKASGWMVLGGGLLLILMKGWVGPTNRLGALIELAVIGLLGGWIYILSIAKNQQLDVVLGTKKAARIRQFLQIETK